MSKETNIYQKLQLVMGACHYISKSGRNDFHNYSYVTSADVLDKVNKAFLDVGLVTTCATQLLDLREVPNAKGNVEKHATVQVDITVTDVDTGESVQFNGLGSGQDSGDKAIMKASTAAIKYAYMLSLCIATGDDPEADNQTDENNTHHKPPTKPNVQQKQIQQSNSSFTCSDCGTGITSKVYSYAMNNYGESLCMNCQKHHQKVA